MKRKAQISPQFKRALESELRRLMEQRFTSPGFKVTPPSAAAERKKQQILNQLKDPMFKGMDIEANPHHSGVIQIYAYGFNRTPDWKATKAWFQKQGWAAQPNDAAITIEETGRTTAHR